MARMVKGENGELRQVARYDTRLMLNPKLIFPNNTKMAAKYIVKKSDAPKGKPSKWYNVEDNSSLVRKAFRQCMKHIIDEVIAGNCKFMMPGRTTAYIYMGNLPHKYVLNKCKNGTNHFDIFATNRKIPVLKYKLGKNTKRPDLQVYVSKDKFQKLIERANTGKIFSQRPREIDYFLPKVYEEFSYLNEESLRKGILYCFRRMSYSLKRGEEMRFLDKGGEIRFYRLLGDKHDSVMRRVVKARENRKNKELEKYGTVS